MEVIFGNSGIGGRFNGLSDAEQGSYEANLKALIDDAVDFEESYLAGVRAENQAYYNGLLPAMESSEPDEEDEPANRSSFVSTDVQDTIMAIMPSLMRIFTSSEHVAMFTPTSEEHQDMAEQATDYVNYVFYKDNEGFMLLHSVFKDALTVKSGFVTWGTDKDHEVTEEQYSGITEEQYQFLLSEAPDVEVTELEQDPDGTLSVTLRFVVDKPKVYANAVPPDEFRINKSAKSIKTARLVGWERSEPMSFLVKKGLDPEELIDYISTSTNYSDERQLRNPALIDDGVLNDGIMYGEYYVRIDGDGDGIDELRYICTVGQDRHIVEDRIVQHVKFAAFGPDPKPHTAIGDCPADIVKSIQRMKTNMMRGQINNLAETLNPRTVVNELITNVEDVLSDEVGAVIRTRGDPNSAVAFSKTPYAGAEVQDTINYLDQVRASRTGITEASKGLDPKAMQSTAVSGIDAIISGAQERIELIARILAETGLKPMLEGLLREVVNHQNKSRSVKLRDKWVDVNPSLYDPNMRLEVNPTLGKGTDIIRLQALGEVKQTQMMIMEKFGPSNPVVTPVEFVNTLTDILAIANIKNPTRYFKAVTPEVMEQINNAPKEPDPASLLAQAELEKVKKDVIIASGNQDIASRKVELEDVKAKADDDFRRDKLNIDSSIRVLDIMTDPKLQTTTPGEPVAPGILSMNRP